MKRTFYFLTGLMLSCYACGVSEDVGGPDESANYEDPRAQANFAITGILLFGNTEFLEAEVVQAVPGKRVVREGDILRFNNRSAFLVYSEESGTLEENARITEVEWEFEGGNPFFTTTENPEVQYAIAGLYDLIIRVRYLDGDEEYTDELILRDHIEVIPNPRFSEFLLEEESGSDGKQLTVAFDNSFFRPSRINRYDNGALVEFSEQDYDPEVFNLLISEAFSNGADNTVLGTREFDYSTAIRYSYEFGDFNTSRADYIERESTTNTSQEVLASYDFSYEERTDRPGSYFVAGAQLSQSDGQGGFLEFDIQYTYDTDYRNVVEERYFQDGQFIGSIGYDFDNNPNVYKGLYLQTFPERSNLNNPTRKTTYDALGAILTETLWEYQYGVDIGNRPESAVKTVDGTTTTSYSYDFRDLYEFN